MTKKGLQVGPDLPSDPVTPKPSHNVASFPAAILGLLLVFAVSGMGIVDDPVPVGGYVRKAVWKHTAEPLMDWWHVACFLTPGAPWCPGPMPDDPKGLVPDTPIGGCSDTGYGPCQ